MPCRVSFRCLVDCQVLNRICSASNNKELCVTETLTNIQTSTGTLTFDQLNQVVPEIAAGDTSSLKGANLCTPCVKQMYNVAKTDFPSDFGQGTTVASNVQADCGASFVGKFAVPRPGLPSMPS